MAKLSNKDDSEDKDASKDQNHPEVDTPVSTEEVVAHKERLIQVTLDLLRHRMSADGDKALPRDFFHPIWSQATSEALKFADLTLRRIEDRDIDIHAYQLFEEQEVLTYEKIAERFRETKWGALQSKNKVEPAIDEIWDHMKEEEVSLEPEDADTRNKKLTEIYRRIRNTFDSLRTDKEIAGVYPELDGKLKGIMAEIQPDADYAQNHELLAAYVQHRALMKWCRETHPHPKQKDKEANYYRPHGIFLYAAVHKLNTEKLIKTWSGLSDDFVPYPEKNLLFALSGLPVPDPWTSRESVVG